MKIGIITYHRALNYGAVLQTYALQQFLKSLNIDCDVIDYKCPYIDNFYKPIKANPIKESKTFLKESVFYPLNSKKRNRFNCFINKFIKLSRPITSREELDKINDEYDFFVPGSDQVWNCKWNGFDKTYFLDFADSNKKYSYSASFGFDEIPEEYRAEYKKLLSDFQGLSVREKTGKNILDSLFEKDVNVNIDPSCLLSKTQWQEVASAPKSDEKYVLVYLLDKSEELIKFAEKLAKERGLKVKFIADAIKKKYDFEYMGFLSPSEFVGLFEKADYVVTNSFHGLMFSVIFEKEFCLQYQKNSGAPNSRLKDFLSEFGLESRLLENINITDNGIDYSDIKNKLEAEKEKSKAYFMKIAASCLVPQNKDKCSGCKACENICPKNAITMTEDEEGFMYPSIDRSLCVSCKKCVDVCQYYDFEKKYNLQYPRNFIAGYNNDEKIRQKSRSGGAYVALSNYILSNGGIVYGASLMPDMSVRHTRAASFEERDSHCGSKYVLSDVNDTYAEALNDLKNGRLVLYSGTACQIAGLLSFLRGKNDKNYEKNLYSVDIICHGAVSPLIWQDNVKEMEKRCKSKIVYADFRDKSFGWDSHIESYLTESKDSFSERRYTSVFYGNSALRPACYNCQFASLNRVSDITLADAWGVKKDRPEWDASKGVSLVMLNTEKATELFNRVKSELTYEQVDINNYMQPNMKHPTEKPSDRDTFWKIYNSKGYSAVADRCYAEYTKIERQNKIKGKIVKILRKLHLK